MEQTVVIHNLDRDSAEWIEREARKRGIQTEEVVRQLIQRGIIVERKKSRLRQYHDLDSLAGTWDQDEADNFLKAIADFNSIDEELWP